MNEPEVVTDTELDPAKLRRWFVLKSSVLDGECVLVVRDKISMEEACAAHPELVVYSPSEVQELLVQKVEPMVCRRIHMVKRVLDGEIVPRTPPSRRALMWLPRGEAYRRALAGYLSQRASEDREREGDDR